MLQPSPVPDTSFLERLRSGAGRRTLGVALALLIELLLLLLLFSLGTGEQPGRKEAKPTIVTLDVDEAAADVPEPAVRESAQQADERPTPEPPATTESLPPPSPLPRPEPAAPPALPTIVPAPSTQLPSTALPATPAPPAPVARRVYGPPSRAGSSASGDTERVGTAPNGEPLYAAAWYREPTDDELRGYLSTASGPGWGLIACRTAPSYRVEDCVALAEYPQGSQINRAILAAAWEFKVRPPRRGGLPLIGSWVRIRIDYGTTRR